MDGKENEDELLRSVALQNARSILLARRRAEEELVQAKEALQKQSEWLRVTLSSIGDAVIATDVEGRVTFLNGVAEALTGWPQAEAVGRPLPEVFRIVNEHTRLAAENPALRSLREGTVVGLANHTVLIARNGTERPIDDSAAPMRAEDGAAVGSVLVFRDATERKRAEEALREREQRALDILESITDAFFALDKEWRFAYVNRQAERLLDRQPGDLLGKVLWDEYPSFAGSEIERAYHRAAHERVTVSLTSYYPDHDRWYETHIYPATEDGLSVYFQDVSERRRAQEALRESEAKFRLMADTIPQLAWMAHPNGDIFWYNRQWYEYTGTSHEQMEGWGWQSVHDPMVLPKVLERWQASIAGGLPFDMVFPLKGADGRFRPFLTRVNPLRNSEGRILYWFGTNTDITEQKRAEEASRFLADASSALADVVDYESTLGKVARLAVPFFADWCAVDMGQADGSLRQLAAVHMDPSKVKLANELARRYPARPDDPYGPMHVLRTGEPQMAAEITDTILVAVAQDEDHLRILRELGLRSHMCVPLATGGRTLGTITFIMSESGRRYGPADLTLAQDLAQRAAVATENARLNDELREADRRKDDFIALLAHELRNPLAPIRSGLQVMRLAEGDVSAVAQARGMMERQLGHMVRLIDDLLDVSRINRNKMELRRSRVPLTDVVSSAVETARPIIDAEGHELNVSLPQRPVFLDADLTRLAQVFSNLLTNSAKYTEPNGRIWLTAERNGDVVVVSVRDNGIGIPAESVANIFGMFSQVDRSIERSSGGLGIGLALVKGLVEMHGGTVTAESGGPGRGSTFTVTLPALTARPEPSAAEAADDGQGVGPKRRILVVDDNRDGADSLAMMLRLLGNEVCTAHDGMEAVERAEAFRPQVILMDVGMPKLNGLDATRRIRECKWGRAMTVIALTGWGQEVDRERSREAGCDGHLVKPVNLPDLQKKLEELQSKAD